jgi:transposase
MKAYSLDLRQRVVQAVHKGMSRQKVVTTFGISLASVKRWLVLEAQGALAPKPIPGKQPHIGLDQQSLLEAQLQAHPDEGLAILDEHVELWEKSQQQHVSRATMARAINHLGYTRKKRAS